MLCFPSVSFTSLSVFSACRHVMNELLETERVYVEELLCVLQVILHTVDGFS